MFPRKNRITEKKDFDRIFRSGKAVHSGLFVLKVMKNDLNINRFGVVVSTKISNKATERNRIKRQMRNLLINSFGLEGGLDIVVYVKKAIRDAKFSEMNQDVSSAIKKI